MYLYIEWRILIQMIIKQNYPDNIKELTYTS